MPLIWSLGHFGAQSAGTNGAARLIGGYTQANEGRPQAQGSHNASIYFDGQGYIEQTTQGLIDIPNKFTVYGWARHDTATGTDYLLSIYPPSGNGNRIDVGQSSGAIFMNVFDSGGVTFFGRAAPGLIVRAGMWFHFACEWDGEKIRIWINGQEQPLTVVVGSTTAAHADANDLKVRIGGLSPNGGGGGLWNGHIHSIAMSSEVHTGDTVRTIWNHGAAGFFEWEENQGGWTNFNDAEHVWQLGENASAASLGADTGQATNTQDLETFSGVSEDDIVAFSPYGAHLRMESNEYLADDTESSVGIANAWSYMTWFRPNALTNAHTLIDMDPSASDNSRIIVYWNTIITRTLRVLLYNSSGTLFKEYHYNDLLLQDFWHQIVVTWNGTDLLLYLNGTLQTADSTPTDNAGTMANDNRRIRIGNTYGGVTGPSVINGFMNQAALWNQVLTDQEVLTLWNGGQYHIPLDSNHHNYGKAGNLQHWWRMGQMVREVLGHDAAAGQGGASPISIQENAENIDTSDVDDDGTVRSVDFDTNESFRNTTHQTVGIADNWSIAGWVELDDIGNAQTLFELDPSSGNANRIQIQLRGDVANDPLRVTVYDAGGTNLKEWDFPFTAATGQWYHFVITWDGTDILCYVDGVSQTPTKNTDNAVTMDDTDARAVYVATASGGSEFFDGRMAQWAMWDDVLGSAEISEIRDSGNGHETASLFDLLTNSGNYTSSADLQHWWKLASGLSTLGGNLVSDQAPVSTGRDIEQDQNLLTTDMFAEDLRPDQAPRGSSVVLDGSSSRLRNEDSSALGVVNAWTLSVTCKPAALTADMALAHFDVSEASLVNAIRFNVRGDLANDPWEVTVGDAVGTLSKQYRKNTVFTVDTWVTLTATWDGTNLRMYVDGHLVTPDVTSPDDVITQDDTGQRKIHIGSREDESDYFNGAVSDVALWSDDLSADEVRQVVTQRPGTKDLGSDFGSYVSSGDLAHWWPIAEAADMIGSDKGTNGRSLIFDNGTNDDVRADSQ